MPSAEELAKDALASLMEYKATQSPDALTRWGEALKGIDAIIKGFEKSAEEEHTAYNASNTRANMDKWRAALEVPMDTAKKVFDGFNSSKGLARWFKTIKTYLAASKLSLEKFPETRKTVTEGLVKLKTELGNKLVIDFSKFDNDNKGDLEKLTGEIDDMVDHSSEIPEAPRGMEIRQYTQGATTKPVYITVLPKGTLLFRGVHSTQSIAEDYCGFFIDKTEGAKSEEMCLSPYHSVYFYPFPFLDKLVHPFETYCMCYTREDIRIVCLINPSPQFRGDKFKPGFAFTSCDKIEHCKKLEDREDPYDPDNIVTKLVRNPGNAYDPCFKPKFIKENPDVLGLIAIPDTDAESFIRRTKAGTLVEPSLYNYIGQYTTRNSMLGAVPEIVLHPRIRPHDPIQEVNTFNIGEFGSWIRDHKDILTFLPFWTMPRGDDSEIKKVMDALLSPEGFTGANGVVSHAKVNRETGFYQIIELSNPFEQTDQARYIDHEDTEPDPLFLFGRPVRGYSAIPPAQGGHTRKQKNRPRKCGSFGRRRRG